MCIDQGFIFIFKMKIILIVFFFIREQAEQQLKQHQELLDQINSFQASLDAVRGLGENQVSRYKDVNQDIEATISKAHQNIQVNYQINTFVFQKIEIYL